MSNSTETCNKTDKKALDEFITRIAECAASVGSRVNLICEINDKLNGSEPQDGCEKKTAADPQTVFDKFNACIENMEITASGLESATNRLNSII